MPELRSSEDCAQDFLYARKTLYQLSYNPALGISVFLTAKVNPNWYRLMMANILLVEDVHR